jgi:hypothetical protein
MFLSEWNVVFMAMALASASLHSGSVGVMTAFTVASSEVVVIAGKA